MKLDREKIPPQKLRISSGRSQQVISSIVHFTTAPVIFRSLVWALHYVHTTYCTPYSILRTGTLSPHAHRLLAGGVSPSFFLLSLFVVDCPGTLVSGLVAVFVSFSNGCAVHLHLPLAQRPSTSSRSLNSPEYPPTESRFVDTPTLPPTLAIPAPPATCFELS